MAIEVNEALISHIARLSRLGLSPAEKAQMRSHFEKILEYVKALDALDLSAVDPSFFPLETANVFRADESGSSLPVDEALRNAPRSGDGFFIVPRIIADAGFASEEEPS